jgi:hypothetical protein
MDACSEPGSLFGLGPAGFEFRLNRITFKPGEQYFAVTSTSKLDKAVRKIDLIIDWQAKSASASTQQQRLDRLIEICGVRHPPQSGWLDELGRLKGGRAVGRGVARCAPYLTLQN